MSQLSRLFLGIAALGLILPPQASAQDAKHMGGGPKPPGSPADATTKGPPKINCLAEPSEAYDQRAFSKYFTLDNPELVAFLRKPVNERDQALEAAALRAAYTKAFGYQFTHDPETCFPKTPDFQRQYCLLQNFNSAQIIKDPTGKPNEIFVLNEGLRQMGNSKTYEIAYVESAGGKTKLNGKYVEVRHKNNQDIGRITYSSGKADNFIFSEMYVQDSETEELSSEIGRCFGGEAGKATTSKFADKNAAAKTTVAKSAEIGIDNSNSYCGKSPALILNAATKYRGFDPDKAILSKGEYLGIVGSGAKAGLREGSRNIANSTNGLCDSVKALYNLATNKEVPDPSNPPNGKIGMFALLKRSVSAEVAKAYENCFESACPSYPEKPCGPIDFVNTNTCTVALLSTQLGEKAVTALTEKIKLCASNASEASKCFADIGVAAAATLAGAGATKAVTAAAGATTTVISGSTALSAGTKTLANVAVNTAKVGTNVVLDATLNQTPIDLDRAASKSATKAGLTAAEALPPPRALDAPAAPNAPAVPDAPAVANAPEARNTVPVLAEASQRQFFTPEASARELASAIDNGGLTVAVGDLHVGRAPGGKARQAGANETRNALQSLGNFLEDNKGKVDRVQITGDIVDAPGLSNSVKRYDSVANPVDKKTGEKIVPKRADGTPREYAGLSQEQVRERVQAKTFEQAFAQVARGAEPGKPIKVDLFYGNHDGAAAKALDLKGADGKPVEFKLDSRGRLPPPKLVAGPGGVPRAVFDPKTREGIEAVFVQKFGNDPARAKQLVDEFEKQVGVMTTKKRVFGSEKGPKGKTKGDGDYFAEAVKEIQNGSPEFGFTFVDPAAVAKFQAIASKEAAKFGGKIEVNVVTKQDYDLALTDVGGQKQLAGHNPVTFDDISAPNRAKGKYLRGHLPDPRQQSKAIQKENFSVVQNSDKHDPQLVAGKNIKGGDDPFYGVSTPVFGAGVKVDTQQASGLVVYGTVKREGKDVLRPFFLEAADVNGKPSLIQSNYGVRSSYEAPTLSVPAGRSPTAQ
jgi:hypothetical protein